MYSNDFLYKLVYGKSEYATDYMCEKNNTNTKIYIPNVSDLLNIDSIVLPIHIHINNLQYLKIYITDINNNYKPIIVIPLKLLIILSNVSVKKK
jgi:hypothetical protein